MHKMMSTKEAASLWGISDRQVSKLCGEGKVSGAVKKGRNWAIPIRYCKAGRRSYKAYIYHSPA